MRAVATSHASRKKTRLQAFSELEVPVRTLLRKDEELRLGRKVQLNLSRLSRWLVHHPAGGQRVLESLREMDAGGKAVVGWYPLKERIGADLRSATAHVRRAEESAAEDSERALVALRKAAAVLAVYPLSPETVVRATREIVAGEPPGALGALPRVRRMHRLIARAWRALEDGRRRLLLPNLKLVLKEVFHYVPAGMTRGDLFQEGILGLDKAVLRFDPRRGFRFSTYATAWIRQSVRRSLMERSRLIRIPPATQEELRRPDSRLDPLEAQRVRVLLKGGLLFSQTEKESADDGLRFELEDRTPAPPLEPLAPGAVEKAVGEALRTLGSRERHVLQHRFGLLGRKRQTLEEIGSRLGLSRERVRQIQERALARLRGSGALSGVYEDLTLAEG